MRPEDKDKILLIAKEYIPREKLNDFARALDELEEERELSIVELVDKTSELIARFLSDRLLSIRDEELRSLFITVTKATVKAIVGPKLVEIFLRGQIIEIRR